MAVGGNSLLIFKLRFAIRAFRIFSAGKQTLDALLRRKQFKKLSTPTNQRGFKAAAVYSAIHILIHWKLKRVKQNLTQENNLA